MKSGLLVLAFVATSSAFVAPPKPFKATTTLMAKSKALPFLNQPAGLDGSMVGDAGFDPLGLSEINDLGIDLYWMREAELKHARVAMMAAAGVLWVELFGSLPGWPQGAGKNQMAIFWDVWAEKPAYIVAGLCFITCAEVISGIATTQGRASGVREPGDFGFNPGKFKVDEKMRLKELKNGRLAMWAAAGMIMQGLTTDSSALGNL